MFQYFFIVFCGPKHTCNLSIKSLKPTSKNIENKYWAYHRQYHPEFLTLSLKMKRLPVRTPNFNANFIKFFFQTLVLKIH